jgi:hypothetical protein
MHGEYGRVDYVQSLFNLVLFNFCLSKGTIVFIIIIIILNCMRGEPINVAARSKARKSLPTPSLRCWVRIPLEPWMFVCVDSGLATG